MSLFFAALLQVLEPHTLALMLLGVTIGLLVGLLPGIGGAATLALMLPFVYPMEPVSAFAFLLGMHAVAAMGGDVTSVLFGIPGEVNSAAAVFDGYPMTRRGEAGRALGAVLFASFVGALIGAAILALSVPVVRPIVLAFGPPEFLMLTVLGLSFIVSLAGHDLMKGFLMATFGFVLAMVGLDPQTGIQRFTFGELYLWEGINVVPVVVGLFGGAEILQLMMTKGSISQQRENRQLSGVMQGVRDVLSHKWLTLRTSAIGVGIGMIPGMGGPLCQFIAYAHAQQTSKHPETFGKGNIEGVVAAGAVSNAREGGSLIPTVAFGIPSSLSMAILLSVFLLKDLVPGPAMLTKNLIVTYSMVWTLVLSNIVAVSVLFLLLNHLARLTYVKGTLLVPFLLVLVGIGAYATHNSMADILLMLAATAVGVMAIKWDWPRSPLLLAMVLGDIAERYLFLSYSLYQWTWLTRPLVLAFATVTIVGVAWPHVRKWRAGASRTAGPSRTRHVLPLRDRIVHFDFWVAVTFLIVGVGVLIQASAWPVKTSAFPLITGSLLAALALLRIVLFLLHGPTKHKAHPEPTEIVEADEASEASLGEVFDTASRRQWATAIGWMASYFVMLWMFGLLITIPVFAVAYLVLASRDSLLKAGIYALVSWAFIYVLFNRLLHIPLPTGVLTMGL